MAFPARQIFWIGVFATAYALMGAYSLWAAPTGSMATYVWPASGLALGVLIRFGLKWWPGVVLGSLIVSAYCGADVPVALAIAVGAGLEALAGAFLAQRVFAVTESRLRRAVVLTMMIIPVSSVVEPSFGIIALQAYGDGIPVSGKLWFIWWFSHVAMAGAMVPFVLAWTRDSNRNPKKRETIELLALTGATIFTCVAVFFTSMHHVVQLAAATLSFPLLVWAALRFDHRATSTLALSLGITAAICTALDVGPLAGMEDFPRWIAFSFFTFNFGAMGMSLSAVIDSQRQGERALRESERRFRELFQNLRAGVMIGQRGRIVVTNPAYARMMGYGPKEEVSHNGTLDKHFPERSLRKIRDYYEARRLGGRAPTRYEVEAIRKDGKIVWLDIAIAAIEWGGTPAVLISAHDVTTRKEAESRLRRQATIIDQMGEAVITTDQNGLVTEFNRAAENMLGYSRDEMLGRSPFEFWDITSASGLEPGEILDYVDEHGYWRAEHSFKRKDGSVGYAATSIMPLRDESGKLIGRVNILRDDTDRHHAIESLRDSEKRFRDFAASASDWFWETDHNLNLTYISERFFETTGFAPDDISSITDALGQMDMQEETLKRLTTDMRARRPIRNVEFVARDHHGERLVLQVTGVPVYDSSRVFKGFRGTGTNVTGRKVAEEQLRQAQKMESVGQLTGGIAHDFNNLLAIIMGNLELLSESVEGDEDNTDLIERALGAAERGAILTQRLLAFSRRQTLDPAEVDVNKLITSLTNLIQRTMGAAIKIKEELDDSIWKTRVDAAQLENAIINLAVNARDAMSQGGQLRITSENITIGVNDLRKFPDGRPGEFVCLTVSDSGCGIPREVLQHVFEPFFTTKEVGKGSGLGLSMIYGFVQQSGGFITVTSEVGKGTTFQIFLPRYKSLEMVAREAKEKSGESAAEAAE